MKRSIIILIVTLFIAGTVSANDNQQYYKAMGQAIGQLFASDSAAQIQGAINTLDRIAKAESDKWEPAYYTAFGYLRLSATTNNATEKDKYLDQALAQVKAGLKVAPNEDELITMKAYVYMMKMVIDPMSRAPEYSPIIMGSYQKALQIDPNNPRAWYLLGQMQLGTAQFMGGSTDEGCASIQNAVDKFAAEKKTSPIAPAWGSESATAALKQCK
ncbi:MAG: tetratricopeptide repeat protein [Bacteroidota bacterium]